MKWYILLGLDTFGNLDADISLTDQETRYLYTGQQYDPYTELYSLRARYYDPMQGRFLSRDTWTYNYQNPFELNRYVYTANNPVNWSDPSGYTVSISSFAGTMIITAAVVATLVIAGSAACAFTSDCVSGLMDSVNWVLNGLARAFTPLWQALQWLTNEYVEQAEQNVVNGVDYHDGQVYSTRPFWEYDWSWLFEGDSSNTTTTITEYDDVDWGLIDQDKVPADIDVYDPSIDWSDYYYDEVKIQSERPDYTGKSIALGFSSFRGAFPPFDQSPYAIVEFASNLRTITGNPQIFAWPEWYSEGLNDVPFDLYNLGLWPVHFSQAVSRAEHIHFNLESMSDPLTFAFNSGGNGSFSSADYTTAWELYVIRYTGLCFKTTFYVNGTSAPTEISAADRSRICNLGNQHGLRGD